VLGPQTNVHIQDLQDPSAFVDGGSGVGTDHCDEGTALRESVGSRKTADTEAGDQDVQR